MLRLKSLEPSAVQAELVVVPICEDTNIYEHPVLTAMTRRVKQLSEFGGAKGDEIVLYDPAEMKSKRALFCGIGQSGRVDPETLRGIAGKAVKTGIQKKLREIVIMAPSAQKLPLDAGEILASLLEGAFLANHRFDRYRKDDKKVPLKNIVLLVTEEAARKYRQLPAQVTAVCEGTLLARDWVNTPSNDKLPSQFARTVAALAKKRKLKVTTMDKKELQQRKFGALLAVSAGSGTAPGMVVIEYAPPGVKNTVALVGKGVTFDTGGINLKTSGSSLAMMKVDMAGAAAVAATMLSVAKRKPKIRVIGVMPLVENMISGSSFRPGDIVTGFNGKTIEIGNTDAEGRLILADAMAYTIKAYKPAFLIDMATLTGACVVALGEGVAGLFTPDDELAQIISGSGETVFERCWRMPMPEDYKKMLESEIADINNMPNSRSGAAITAALFLKEFVDKTRWAHIDIAGTAYRKKGNDYCGPGATGFGVRLLCEILDRLSR